MTTMIFLNVLNVLLLCVGLVICFGGNYNRKVVSGLSGFVWGGILGIFVFPFIAPQNGYLYDLYEALENYPNGPRSLVVMAVFAVIVCIASVASDRLFVGINAFLSSFIIVLSAIPYFIQESIIRNPLEFEIHFAKLALITTIICVGIGIAAYRYFNYAFIIVTTVSGAYIAAMECVCLIAVMVHGFDMRNDLFGMLCQLLFYQDESVLVVGYGIFIVLGVCSFFVQQRRLKSIQSGTAVVSGENPTTVFSNGPCRQDALNNGLLHTGGQSMAILDMSETEKKESSQKTRE